MSIVNRHFPPTFIAPKIDSLFIDLMNNSKVFFSCYGYFTNLLSDKTHFSHLISGSNRDSFLANYLCFIDFLFSSKKKVGNINMSFNKLALC